MSHTLTALIADDEEAPRAQLKAALQQAWPELQIVAEAANGVDAWDAYLVRVHGEATTRTSGDYRSAMP
jgi:DNA-binding LytR/AlgR family response regulator